MATTNLSRKVWLLAFAKLKVRRCYSLHHCVICMGNIVAGSVYHDGGYGHRAHVACVKRELEALESSGASA